MRTTLKIVKWSLVAILSLLLLIMGMSYYLLATDNGYQKVPDLLNRFTDYKVTYQSLEGNLFSNQQWQDIRVSGPGLSFLATDLKLNINRADLLHLKLHIKQAVLKNGQLDLVSSAPSKKKSSQEFEKLPQLDLPVAVIVDDLNVENFQVNQDKNNLIYLNQVTLNASLIKGELLAGSKADVSQGANEQKSRYQADVNIEGRLIDEYPLQLAGNFTLDLPGMQSEKINIQLDNSVLKPNLSIDAQGWLNGKLNADADVDLSHKHLQANLDWKDVAYSEGVFESAQGNVKLAGAFDDLMANLSLRAQGTDIPTSDITAEIKYTGDEIQLNTLALDSTSGRVDLSGSMSLGDLKWQAEGSLAKFNISDYLNNLNGKIDAHFQTSGSMIDNNLKANLDISRLAGKWEGQNLDGVVHVAIDGNNVDIKKMDLAVGANKISAKGNLENNNLDFSFELDAPTLSQFYTGLKGNIVGSGSVTGKLKAPNANLYLTGKNIAFETTALQALDININTTFDDTGDFNNKIALNGLALDKDNQWSVIRLDTKGSIDNHVITLRTDGGAYNAQIAAAGALTDFSNWDGVINQFNITGNDVNLKLKHSVNAMFSGDKVAINNFCVVDQYSDLCVSVDKNEETKLNYQINKFDLKTVSAFVPELIKSSSTLKGDGEFTISADNKIRGNTSIDITEGHLLLTLPDQPPVNFKINKSSVKGEIADGAGSFNLSLDIDKSSFIKANAKITDMYGNAKIDGALDLSLDDVGKFKNFIPQLSDLEGEISGDMKVKGDVERPILDGQISLKKGKVIIPEYATELNNITLDLLTDGDNKIKITGNVGTPKGALKTDGYLSLTPLSLEVNLKGQDMQVANSKEVKVTVNPDFNIKLLPHEGLIVRGVIQIPSAQIAIPDMESAQQSSSDIKIVDNVDVDYEDKEPGEPAIPIDAEISVKLGDKVYFKNADVNIRLIGGIKITMKPGQSMISQGRIEIASGVYELYGQELTISKGTITFSGDITNPILDVLASRDIDTVEVGAAVAGTPDNLTLTLTSDPAMPDTEILSYLLFGSSSSDSSSSSTALLQAAASAGVKGVLPDDLAEKTGLDVLDIGVTGLRAGKYIFTGLYIGMETDFIDDVSYFLARYQLSRRVSLEGSVGTEGNSVHAVYQFETN